MQEKIMQIRREYLKSNLVLSDLDKNPILQFKNWFSQALNSNVIDPNAMVLSTANKKGIPNARVVLLKDITHKGFLFYTNYNSVKGIELLENPLASITFFWPQLDQQIRVLGKVKKIPYTDSEKYFKTRPRKSQIASIVSKQSTKIHSKKELSKKIDILDNEFKNKELVLPKYWGGYELIPINVEFWQGRPSRLHDRFLYSLENKKWIINRLSP